MSSRRRALLAVVPATAVIALLFGGALVGAVRTSLQPGPGGLLGEPGLSAWRDALGDPAFVDAVVFSGRVTVLATAIGAVLATGAALLLRDHGPTLRGLFGFPVLVPHLVVAVVAVLWIGPGGLADRLLGSLPVTLIRDRAGWGIVLVYVYKEVPFLTLLLLAGIDRTVLEREEAAALLGAGPWQRFRVVLLPALRMPLVVGSLIIAAFTFGAFEVPLTVGPTYPPTLPVLALQATQRNVLTGRSVAAALLLVAAAVSVALALLAAREVRRDAG